MTTEDRAELLATIDESSDQMTELVENLLSLSRLQAGALSVHRARRARRWSPRQRCITGPLPVSP